MVCKKIHIPPSPTHCVKIYSGRAYEIFSFFALFSEVSIKDKSVRTETRRIRWGRAGFAVQSKENRETTLFSLFYFIINDKKRWLIDFFN